RPRQSAEMGERRRDALAPIVATLIEKRFDEEAAGVTEHGDQQEDADAHAGNLQSLLTEIDLQLVAGRRFDANRRQLRNPLLPADVGHRPLQRPYADRESALGQQ